MPNTKLKEMHFSVLTTSSFFSHVLLVGSSCLNKTKRLILQTFWPSENITKFSYIKFSNINIHYCLKVLLIIQYDQWICSIVVLASSKVSLGQSVLGTVQEGYHDIWFVTSQSRPSVSWDFLTDLKFRANSISS
jgi:hypothetical protein